MAVAPQPLLVWPVVAAIARIKEESRQGLLFPEAEAKVYSTSSSFPAAKEIELYLLRFFKMPLIIGIVFYIIGFTDSTLSFND